MIDLLSQLLGMGGQQQQGSLVGDPLIDALLGLGGGGAMGGLFNPQPQQPFQPIQNGGAAPQSQVELYNIMRQMGIPDIHAQGMLANIQGESNFNPRAIGDGGKSFGLFQHYADRGQALKQFSGGDWTNPVKQLQYAITEPDTQKYLSTPFRNWQDASKNFTTQWERPANPLQKAADRQRKYRPLNNELLARLNQSGRY
jgi:hypothetical protein